MDVKERLEAFGKLVDAVMNSSGDAFYRRQYEEMLAAAEAENPLLTERNIRDALETLVYNLQMPALTMLEKQIPPALMNREASLVSLVAEKDVLSGVPDWLMAMLSGNSITFQLPENNRRLLPAVVSWFVHQNPEYKSLIAFTEGKIEQPDYLFTYPLESSEKKHLQYFSRYQGVVRRKRKAVAVLNGKESSADLALLVQGVMKFFNQGAHRIAKIFVPQAYDFSMLLESFSEYSNLKDHNRYLNNYEYYKSIYLLNRDNFYDNEIVLLKQDDESVLSPLSVIYFSRFDSPDDIRELNNRDDISAVYGKGGGIQLPFSKAAMPVFAEWEDYSRIRER